VKYLLQFAGKDLSVYFDPNGSPKMRYASTGQYVPVFPPAFELATSEFAGNCKACWWWEDPMYKIGAVTKQERKVRIINALTLSIRTLKVCEEDTIADIQAKYQRYNTHFGSYEWNKFGPSVSHAYPYFRVLYERSMFISEQSEWNPGNGQNTHPKWNALQSIRSGSGNLDILH
jgi:hypothetical protein